MEKENQSLPFSLLLFLLVAAATRLIPHPFNFTAIGALALFSGANVKNKKLAFLLPLSILLLTDLIIGLHISMIPVYLAFAVTVLIGRKISNKQSPGRIIFASLGASILFFLLTNLPFWYADLSLYPMTLQGTIQSYLMALPFFTNQLLGDLFYTTILFTAFYFYRTHRSPKEVTISSKK